MIYLSPTEHDLTKVVISQNHPYKISSICEESGADIIIPTPKGFVAFQRKTLPDLKASLIDGRLNKELAQLRSSPTVSYPFLILEYNPSSITTDGSFLNVDLSISTLWSILTKVQLLGVNHLAAKSVPDTLNCVIHVAKYIGSSHSTTLKRATPPSSGWGHIDNKDYLTYLLQSFPGIGPSTADAIISHYGTVPIQWNTTPKELAKVKGVGKKTAERIYSILNDDSA